MSFYKIMNNIRDLIPLTVDVILEINKLTDNEKLLVIQEYDKMAQHLLELIDLNNYNL